MKVAFASDEVVVVVSRVAAQINSDCSYLYFEHLLVRRDCFRIHLRSLHRLRRGQYHRVAGMTRFHFLLSLDREV